MMQAPFRLTDILRRIAPFIALPQIRRALALDGNSKSSRRFAMERVYSKALLIAHSENLP